MTTILIGIDDTDNHTSKGTGYLARQLVSQCQARGMQSLGVTRHQFLVDPRIPYTSHNSGACLALAADDGLDSMDFAFDFVAQHAHEGSDPGLCIAQMQAVTPEIVKFGNAATCQVLDIAQALAAADTAGISLRSLGGSGQGVIGALGSVGLRSCGNCGRFLDLPGLRDIPDRVDAAAFSKLGISLEHRSADRKLAARRADVYETLGWIRPRLIEGKPVLIVQWSEQYDAWVPVDRKRTKHTA